MRFAASLSLSFAQPIIDLKVAMPLPRLAILIAVLALMAPAARAEPVTVFAAASLTNAMAEVEEVFEAATGHDLVVSLAGSSALARQIQQGAPADVFISANTDWMDVLEADGLIDSASRFDLLGNSLVLIGHGNNAAPIDPAELPSLLGGRPLAMALVDAVPAGIYGKAALESLDLWDVLAPHVAQVDNVRAALALVALGEASFGITYATDAVASDAVTVVATLPEDSHPPIRYPVARVAGADTPATEAFLSFLHSDEARAAFERQGFTVFSGN